MSGKEEWRGDTHRDNRESGGEIWRSGNRWIYSFLCIKFNSFCNNLIIHAYLSIYVDQLFLFLLLLFFVCFLYFF